uniref:Uncharacterized protein n=1 Tax=Romanomermis culicivorax TaxID=13658 RepID=A0A915HMH0_ROMCU
MKANVMKNGFFQDSEVTSKLLSAVGATSEMLFTDGIRQSLLNQLINDIPFEVAQGQTMQCLLSFRLYLQVVLGLKYFCSNCTLNINQLLILEERLEHMEARFKALSSKINILIGIAKAPTDYRLQMMDLQN